jgi:hypothetical protein
LGFPAFAGARRREQVVSGALAAMDEAFASLDGETAKYRTEGTRA